MLTFKQISKRRTVVLIGLTVTGYIHEVTDGYRYIPVGQEKKGGIKGDVFETLTECKDSLRVT